MKYFTSPLLNYQTLTKKILTLHFSNNFDLKCVMINFSLVILTYCEEKLKNFNN